jgi:hypothetical protein
MSNSTKLTTLIIGTILVFSCKASEMFTEDYLKSKQRGAVYELNYKASWEKMELEKSEDSIQDLDFIKGGQTGTQEFTYEYKNKENQHHHIKFFLKETTNLEVFYETLPTLNIYPKNDVIFVNADNTVYIKLPTNKDKINPDAQLALSTFKVKDEAFIKCSDQLLNKVYSTNTIRQPNGKLEIPVLSFTDGMPEIIDQTQKMLLVPISPYIYVFCQAKDTKENLCYRIEIEQIIEKPDTN